MELHQILHFPLDLYLEEKALCVLFSSRSSQTALVLVRSALLRVVPFQWLIACLISEYPDHMCCSCLLCDSSVPGTGEKELALV